MKDLKLHMFRAETVEEKHTNRQKKFDSKGND